MAFIEKKFPKNPHDVTFSPDFPVDPIDPVEDEYEAECGAALCDMPDDDAMYAALRQKPNGMDLLRAHELLNGDRNDAYGDPVEMCEREAAVLNILFLHKLKVPFVAEDMPMVMKAMKMLREIYCHKEDNPVDDIAYTSMINDIHRRNAS